MSRPGPLCRVWGASQRPSITPTDDACVTTASQPPKTTTSRAARGRTMAVATKGWRVPDTVSAERGERPASLRADQLSAMPCPPWSLSCPNRQRRVSDLGGRVRHPPLDLNSRDAAGAGSSCPRTDYRASRRMSRRTGRRTPLGGEGALGLRGLPGGDAPRSSSLGTGCSTSASTRVAMKRAVRTTDPLRVTSLTSTTPLRTAVSTRRPALLATTSYVRVVSPASTTISTRSPFTIQLPLLRRTIEISHGPGSLDPRLPDHPSSFPPGTDNRSAKEGAAYERTGARIRKLCHVTRTTGQRGWTWR